MYKNATKFNAHPQIYPNPFLSTSPPDEGSPKYDVVQIRGGSINGLLFKKEKSGNVTFRSDLLRCFQSYSSCH